MMNGIPRNDPIPPNFISPSPLSNSSALLSFMTIKLV